MSDQFPAPIALSLEEVRRDLKQSEAERQAAQKEAALLRGELQHRMRNMLATVRTVFARTVAGGGSLEDVADHFRGRFDTIARYQSLLATEPGTTIDFECMVRDELQSFQFGDHPQISVTGPPARLAQEAAQVIGLALHELTTNSIKFGALATEGAQAHLDIAWTVAESMLHFEWRETGVAVLAQAPLDRGFGREFIEDALSYQLGAITNFELRPGGVICAIDVRLDAPAARPWAVGDV
jgi:two-component sensor histidine kinase